MDMPRLFPIGEVAKLFNLSVSSLRDPGDDIPFPSPDGVIEWYKGSGLRPYLDLLDSGEKEEFLADLRSTVAANFPARQNGSVILKMPRLFFTAVK